MSFLTRELSQRRVGGPGWCRSNYASGGGFTVRSVCRFGTDPYGAHSQIRTGDLFLTKEVLYLLSYVSTWSNVVAPK